VCACVRACAFMCVTSQTQFPWLKQRVVCEWRHSRILMITFEFGVSDVTNSVSMVKTAIG
jgi:hypothetical protein